MKSRRRSDWGKVHSTKIRWRKTNWNHENELQQTFEQNSDKQFRENLVQKKLPMLTISKLEGKI